MRFPRLLVAALVAVGGPVYGVSAVAAAPQNNAVQVLAINDLHGRISVPSGPEGRLVTEAGPDGVFGTAEDGESDDAVVRVGGASNVAATVQILQAEFRREAGGSAASFFVGAGDMVGTSPPESLDFRDEPTIEVLNALGLDVSSVGDDEFNLGTQELRRISAATDGQFTDGVTACQGVTPGVDGCFGEGEHAFTGAQFPYLAANVVSRQTGEPILPPHQVLYTPLGVRVALIGVVTQTTPRLVPPEGIADVEFLDEAEAVNRSVQELRADGVEAIGVLVHEGGLLSGPAAQDPNGCDQLTGPIVDINNRIDPAVDLILSGHLHAAYNCMLPVPNGQPRLVTQAGSYGQLVTDVRLTLDPTTGDVDRSATYSARNVPVTRSVPDASVQEIVDYWAAGPGNQPGSAAAGGATEVAPVPTAAPDSSVRWLGGVAILAIVGLGVAAWLVHRWRLRQRPAPAYLRPGAPAGTDRARHASRDSATSSSQR